MEQVRNATADDLERLMELVAGFAGSQADRRGAGLSRRDDGAASPPPSTVDAVAPYLTDPTRTALVGLLDDWVAGAALCRVVAGGTERRGVLDLCFVEEGAREVGLGHLLVERAIAWFRERDCSGVDGTAYPGDRAAKNFFESAGFKARLLVMHRPLD
jgi:GNAT superfamily N-acetyltransferase